VDDETFTAQDVSLVDTDNKTILSCDLSGRMTRSNVLFDKDMIHLFTIVRDILCFFALCKQKDAVLHAGCSFIRH